MTAGQRNGGAQLVDIDRLTRDERESLRAAATRNLVECCDQCRDLLRAQLQADANIGAEAPQGTAVPKPREAMAR